MLQSRLGRPLPITEDDELTRCTVPKYSRKRSHLMIDWITEPVFNFQVEKHEIPRSGGRPYLPNTGPLNLVLHTTEGSTVAGALATLGQNVDPSHFVVGQGRIIQLRPVNAQAAALHDPMNVSC